MPNIYQPKFCIFYFSIRENEFSRFTSLLIATSDTNEQLDYWESKSYCWAQVPLITTKVSISTCFSTLNFLLNSFSASRCWLLIFFNVVREMFLSDVRTAVYITLMPCFYIRKNGITLHVYILWRLHTFKNNWVFCYKEKITFPQLAKSKAIFVLYHVWNPIKVFWKTKLLRKSVGADTAKNFFTLSCVVM